MTSFPIQGHWENSRPGNELRSQKHHILAFLKLLPWDIDSYCLAWCLPAFSVRWIQWSQLALVPKPVPEQLHIWAAPEAVLTQTPPYQGKEFMIIPANPPGSAGCRLPWQLGLCQVLQKHWSAYRKCLQVVGQPQRKLEGCECAVKIPPLRPSTLLNWQGMLGAQEHPYLICHQGQHMLWSAGVSTEVELKWEAAH